MSSISSDCNYDLRLTTCYLTLLCKPVLRFFTNASDLISRIPGRFYLLVASIIFGAANSATRKVTEIGAQNLIDSRNPISFCNVLFVGNLCALILLTLIYRQSWIDQLKQLSPKDWFSLVVVGALSGAIAPALIFIALGLTMVNNVVLIGRIEPLLALALSILLLRERVNFWVVAGSVVSFIGVVLTILLQPQTKGFIYVGRGELMTAAGAVFLSISSVVSKAQLRQVSLGVFTITKTIIGTIVFFFAAIELFGPDHFVDIFSPLLWQWMLFYSAVIVVGGQLSWFRGLKTSSASEVSFVSSFIPITSILAAYFILREQPNFAQYIGGSIILAGIALSQIGVLRQNATIANASLGSSAKEMDIEVGFKGV